MPNLQQLYVIRSNKTATGKVVVYLSLHGYVLSLCIAVLPALRIITVTSEILKALDKGW